MPLPRFSSRYPDVREVFDYALAQSGARYTLPSPGQATHWRARAYSFRKVLWGEINAANPSPPLPTPYDGIKITLDGCDCIIHVETAAARGTLSPLSTETPPPVAEANEAGSELESEAEELAKRLGIEL